MRPEPYLQENRLSEVVAAIQALGTYRFYKLDFAGWADRISGDVSNAEHWKSVFVEHPEFFRLDSRKQKASLVLRRQHPKRFDVDLRKEISRDKFYSHEDQSRVSRLPLSAGELSQLIDTAIQMHAHALEKKRDRNALLLAVVSAVSALVGGLLGASLGG